MADDEPLLDTVVKYIDVHGRKQEMLVSRATARGIRRIRKKYIRDIRRWEEQHVPFAQLTNRVTERQPDPSEDESYARSRLREDYIGLPWEGPLFKFDHLIGESSIWPIPKRDDGRCEACLDRRLEYRQACLLCNRTGRDLAVPVPSKADLAKRKVLAPRRPDGLSGGVGKAKAPKPPTEKQQVAKRDKANRKATARRKAAREAKYAARRARPKF